MGKSAKPAGLMSAAKLRAIADKLERETLREVAELRRLADLMDGVARVTRAKAKPKKNDEPESLPLPFPKKRAAKKTAKKTTRKVTKKAAKKTTARRPRPAKVSKKKAAAPMSGRARYAKAPN